MKIEKIFSNKLIQSFSIFRAIYGLAIVLIAYFFTQKYNLNIYSSLPIFIFSIFFSKYIFKKLKKRFNL